MSAPRESSKVVTVIGIFKLMKATLLYTLAIGALHAQKSDVAESLRNWARAFRIDPHAGYVDAAIGKIAGMSPHEMKVIVAGTLVYAVLFTVEGCGLLAKKIWAEWLTVVATGSLIPLEIAMTIHHVSVSHVATLVVNVAAVIYLVIHRLQVQRGVRSRGSSPLPPEEAQLRRRQIRAEEQALRERSEPGSQARRALRSV